MKSSKILLVAAALMILASTALGAPKKKKKKGKKKEPEPVVEVAPEPEPAPEPTPEAATVEGGASAEVGVGAGVGGGAGADVSATADFGIGDWTQEIIKRPPTLRKGMARLEAGIPLGLVSSTTIDPMTMMPKTESAFGASLAIGGGYGVSDKIEAGASYQLALQEFEAKGPFKVYGAFNFMHKAKMKAAANLGFVYHVGAKTGAFVGGIFLQYNLNEKMAVYMPATHLNAVIIADDPDAAGPLKAPTKVDFAIPAGFAYQVDAKIYGFAETSLVSFGISNSSTGFLFADFIPLTVGAFYAMSNKMEIGAALIIPDVPSAGDAIAVGLVGRMYMGDGFAPTPPPAVRDSGGGIGAPPVM